jgi:hypothetical protein
MIQGRNFWQRSNLKLFLHTFWKFFAKTFFETKSIKKFSMAVSNYVLHLFIIGFQSNHTRWWLRRKYQCMLKFARWELLHIRGPSTWKFFRKCFLKIIPLRVKICGASEFDIFEAKKRFPDSGKACVLKQKVAKIQTKSHFCDFSLQYKAFPKSGKRFFTSKMSNSNFPHVALKVSFSEKI